MSRFARVIAVLTYFCLIFGRGAFGLETKFPHDSLGRAPRTYPGGAKEQFSYDDIRRLTRILAKDSADSPVMDYKYEFLTGLVVNKKTTEHGIYNYSYDDGYRLT